MNEADITQVMAFRYRCECCEYVEFGFALLTRRAYAPDVVSLAYLCRLCIVEGGPPA